MKKHQVEYIDLPLTNRECVDLCQMEGHEHHPDVQDRGDIVRISFDDKEQVSRAGINKPRVENLQELKIGFVTYLKEVDPTLLECKVEKFLWDRGYHVLWNPPYCPELQPIDLFWAAGKNHVAMNYVHDQTMQNVVKYLREA